MRKRTLTTASVTAACGLVLAVAGQASASTGGVLTVGAAGGSAPNVNVGDILTGPISSNFVFTTSSGKITCSSGKFTATDSTNGPVGGTATESITQLHADAASCTTTISGTTAVVSVEINGAAAGTVTDGASPTLHVTNLDEKVSLKTILGTNVVCDFGVTGTAEIDGALSNTTNGVTFTSQAVSKLAGSSLCPATGTFSGGIAPITDTTQAGQKTFVN